MTKEQIKQLYRKENNRTRVLYRVLKYSKYYTSEDGNPNIVAYNDLWDVFATAFDIAPHFVQSEKKYAWMEIWWDALKKLNDVGYVLYNQDGDLIVK